MEENINEEVSSENQDVNPAKPTVIAESEKEKKVRSVLTFVVGFLAGVIAIGIVGVSMFLTMNKIRNDRLMQNVQEIQETQNSNFINSETLTKLEYIENLLKVVYYEDVEDEELEKGMYEGLVTGLGDPYSCYYSEEEINEMYSEWSGNYEGIGAYLKLDTESGYATVESFIKGGSAEESGLEPGDMIVAVDGEPAYGMTLDEVVSLIKGEAGTMVTLTVINNSGRREVSLERREITSPSVSVSDKGDGIYYISITEFADNTAEQFEEAMNEVRTSGAQALIFDLRGNPGGNLDTVVKVCDGILPEGDVVYTEDKAGKQVHYKSMGNSPLDIPLVVLVDGASASAAEIMAGAIKDYGIGTLIGTTTFGKGIVQSVIPLYDGSAVKVTTSRYFTPNGVNIHNTGIKPDVEVLFDAEKYLEDETDNQLEYAIGYLKNKLGIIEVEEESELPDDDAA